MSTYPHTVKPGLAEKTNVSNFGHGISLPIVIPLSTFAIIVWKSMDYVFPHPWRHAHLSDICSTHESDPHPAMAKEENPHLYMHRILARLSKQV